MNKSLAIKLSVIGAIMVLLLIPLGQTKGLVKERQDRHWQVMHEIAASSSSDQLILGPILVLPYLHTTTSWQVNKHSGEKELQEKVEQGALHFLPDALSVMTLLNHEIRSRSIYQTQIYHADMRLTGKFAIPAKYGLDDLKEYAFQKPFVMVSMTDMRGIESAVEMFVAGEELEALPGSNLEYFTQGVHGLLPQGQLPENTLLSFDIALDLQGTESLKFVPIGKETKVHMQSDWPHPSFIGRYLPKQREISEDSFSANWETSFFSTNMPTLMKSCFDGDECQSLINTQLGVSFVDPISLYVKSERAIKYAIVFVLLSFVGVFLFEVLKRMRVHPVQYALVGLAIAMFYLLLLSLSEHIAFIIAYAFSAISCAGLIGCYIGFALRSMARGVSFGGVLLALYALFYGLLNSEDFALVTGSILAFAVLAVVMMLTRRLDWYELGEQLDFRTEKSSPAVEVKP